MGEERDEGEVDTVTVSDTPRMRATKHVMAQLPARFTVKQELGEGGMGTVVEAYDRVLSRDVAIKILARDHKVDPHVGTRFLREARAAARVRHPGIVQVHDIDPEGGYIVMELVRGESLAQRLWRDKTLSVDEVRRIGTAMLAALGAAHQAGIVHRDVKPANVLLGEGGEVKLADFGVAYFGDSDLTQPGTRVGTPAYMAPEQLRGKDVDARADVYAAGITLFEAATGERPDDDDKLYDPYTKLVMATGNTVFAEAIRRAIRERPGDRWANALAFLAAFEVTEAPSAPPKARAQFPTLKRKARWPYAVAGIAAIAMAAGGAALYARFGDRAGSPAAAPVAPVRVDKRTVALVPFVDRTKNPMLDFAPAGLPNLLGLQLHGVPDLTVVGYYQLSGIAGTNAPAEAWVEAGRKLGADLVVRGEITGSGATVHLVIEVATIDGVRLDAIERDARVEEIPDIVRRAAPLVSRIALGRDSGATAAKTTSFDADRELQLGIFELDREHIPDAIEHLRAAVKHAPEEVLPHYYLGIALSWDVPPAGPAQAEINKALATGKLDEAQRGVLAGLSRIAEIDYTGAIEVLRPIAKKFPDNRDLLYAYFEALFHGGYPEEAMSVYRTIHEIAPKYRLALVHVMTYYFSHADEAGMKWGLELNHSGGDFYNPMWEPRNLVAHRDYTGAIQLLSRQLEGKDNRRELQHDLAIAYALSDQIDLASALARTLLEQNVNNTAHMMLGLASARGDDAGRRKWLDATMSAIALEPQGPPRGLPLALLIGAHAPIATKAELAALVTALDGSAVPTMERSLNRQLAQVFAADGLDDRAKLDELAKSPYPEVSHLARAAIARRAGDMTLAVMSMRRSIDATGDGRFLVTQWWRLAKDLVATGDHAATIAACDEVIRPRLVLTWAWGSTVGDCLAWTAEAHEALGHAGEAQAAWARLLRLRNAAPVGDALVERARAHIKS